ncbi:MAG: L,D-transpeptidase [Gammaproteobacteria bacterium]|nr:L,D-transpeptidase [Gammaproteobacteria bacterium]
MQFHLYSRTCQRLTPLVIFVCVLVVPAAFVQAGTLTIEVYKSDQQLIVKDGDTIIKKYRVASGRGGEGTKMQLGDKKTPIGEYKILEFRANSRFHFFMQINYPNPVDAWYGYKNDLINGKEFKEIIKASTVNEIPPQDTRLGGYIGLHGIGEMTDDKISIHERHDWTEGCIAMTNEEITELRQFVTIGTPILIFN